jgi:actin-related protein
VMSAEEFNALRRELDETNLALEEKDEKLKILEKFMLEEALGAEKKKEDEQSRALEHATVMSAEFVDSQKKVEELNEKLAEQAQLMQVIERMGVAPEPEQQTLPEETMVDEEAEETMVDEEEESDDESTQTPMSRRQQASQYFNGMFKRVHDTALTVGSRHGGSVHGKSSENGKQLPSDLNLSFVSSDDGESVHSAVSSDGESVHDKSTAEDGKSSEEE